MIWTDESAPHCCQAGLLWGPVGQRQPAQLPPEPVSCQHSEGKDWSILRRQDPVRTHITEMETHNTDTGRPNTDAGTHNTDTGTHNTDTGTHNTDTETHNTDSGTHKIDTETHNTDP